MNHTNESFFKSFKSSENFCFMSDMERRDLIPQKQVNIWKTTRQKPTKIMYYCLQAYTNIFSATFLSKKYHITTASPLLFMLFILLSRASSLFNDKKKYQQPSSQMYVEGDPSTHGIIVHTYTYECFYGNSKICENNMKIPTHFHKILRSGIHLESY